MAIKKLTIVNGIIQDKFIDGIPVKVNVVEPKGKRNVRTLTKMKDIIGITNHNTGNDAPSADDDLHAKWLQNVENADKQYVSVPLFVDDNSITQTIPIDEQCYHAGDGKGNGNMKTIGIEICQNGNDLKAEENAKKLNAALILTYPHFKVFKHQDWSGKYCPAVILAAGRWESFKAGIQAYVNGAKTLPKQYITKYPLPDILLIQDDDQSKVAVKLLQKALRALGFYFGEIDGVFGRKTRAAVEAIQGRLGISVDGDYGPKTRKAMAKELERKGL